MLFHYSVPGFICRKERSSGFDQRKNKGRRRSLFQRPPSIILSSSSLSLSLSLTTIHHLVLILFTLAPHLEVERSRDLLCGLYLDRSKWNLFLALHLFVPSRCIFHEKRIAANFQNSKCLMHSFGQFFTFKAQLLQKESRNSARI